MTHALLSRSHLEALLVARAIVHRDEAHEILRDVDRDRLSPAAWALVAQLVNDGDEAISCTTDGQIRLAARVDAITVADLCAYPTLDTLLSLVNQLPERVRRVPAWERDLMRAAS